MCNDWLEAGIRCKFTINNNEQDTFEGQQKHKIIQGV